MVGGATFEEVEAVKEIREALQGAADGRVVGMSSRREAKGAVLVSSHETSQAPFKISFNNFLRLQENSFEATNNGGKSISVGAITMHCVQAQGNGDLGTHRQTLYA